MEGRANLFASGGSELSSFLYRVCYTRWLSTVFNLSEILLDNFHIAIVNAPEVLGPLPVCQHAFAIELLDL